MSLAHTYARVLAEAGTEKGFLDKLFSYMKIKGHLSLLPQILRLVHRMPEKDTVVVTVRDQDDAKKFKKEIDMSLTELVVKGSRRVIEDKRLVGGYSIRAGGKIVDKSYRSALVALYQNSVK